MYISNSKPYTGNRVTRRTSAESMTKKLKVHYQDRINRTLKIPVKVHFAVKELAQKQSISIAEFYDQIIYSFLKETTDAQNQISYVFPPQDAKRTNLYLREKTLALIQKLSTRDCAPGNLIIFTAIMDYIKSNSVLTD